MGVLDTYHWSLSITRLFYLVKLLLTMDNYPKPPISATQKSKFFRMRYRQLDMFIYIS
ncbi:hypothetical protein K438DRAFT_1845287, partial [Mycena galopus ATCC 62051]